MSDYRVLARHTFIKYFKGNAQFIQKVTFEPLMDFKENHYESWKPL